MDMNRIKVVLAEKQIKQKELAELTGKNVNTISRICKNESQPTIGHLFEIADALQVDVRELLAPNKFANEK